MLNLPTHQYYLDTSLGL